MHWWTSGSKNSLAPVDKRIKELFSTRVAADLEAGAPEHARSECSGQQEYQACGGVTQPDFVSVPFVDPRTVGSLAWINIYNQCTTAMARAIFSFVVVSRKI